jgi:hypothetical protein
LKGNGKRPSNEKNKKNNRLEKQRHLEMKKANKGSNCELNPYKKTGSKGHGKRP